MNEEARQQQATAGDAAACNVPSSLGETAAAGGMNTSEAGGDNTCGGGQGPTAATEEGGPLPRVDEELESIAQVG